MPMQIVSAAITRDELRRIAGQQFGDFVKAVVDVQRGVMAIGAELHAARVRELLCHATLGSPEYGTTLEDLDRYLLAFAVAARNGREQARLGYRRVVAPGLPAATPSPRGLRSCADRIG